MLQSTKIFSGVFGLLVLYNLNIISCESCRLQNLVGREFKKYIKFRDLMPKAVYAQYEWPSQDDIKKMTVFKKSYPVVNSSMYYLKYWETLFLAKEWSPGSNAEWLFVGKSKENPYDSMRVKWRKNGDEFMLVITRGFLLYKVTLLDMSSFGVNKSKRISRLKNLAKKFMQTQPQVEKILRGRLNNYSESFDQNFLFDNIKSFDQNDVSVLYRIHAFYGGRSRWYEMINWFSYKNIFCMYFLTETGSEAFNVGYGANVLYKEVHKSLAYKIGFEELKRRTLRFDRHVRVVSSRKGDIWTVIFNKGLKDEVTISIAAQTGKVLNVQVDKKIAEESRKNPAVAEESYLNDIQLQAKQMQERRKINKAARLKRRLALYKKPISGMSKIEKAKFDKTLMIFKYFETKKPRTWSQINRIFRSIRSEWVPYYRNYKHIPNYARLKELFPNSEEPQLLDAAFKECFQDDSPSALAVLDKMKNKDKDIRYIEIKLLSLSRHDISRKKALAYLDNLIKKNPVDIQYLVKRRNEIQHYVKKRKKYHSLDPKESAKLMKKLGL
jgi:hypothetical protein